MGSRAFKIATVVSAFAAILAIAAFPLGAQLDPGTSQIRVFRWSVAIGSDGRLYLFDKGLPYRGDIIAVTSARPSLPPPGGRRVSGFGDWLGI